MSRGFVRLIEAVVVIAGVVAALVSGATLLGSLPEGYGKWAYPLFALCTLLEAGWRAIGREAWRDSVVRGLIENDLELAREEMEGFSKARIRTCLMRPKGWCRKALRVEFSSNNMGPDRDRGIRLERWQGCAGKSWGHGKPVTANLTLPPQVGGPDWSMTPDLIDLTGEVKAVLSFPVFTPERGATLFGILNFDSKDGIAEVMSSPEAVSIAHRHARSISAIIQVAT